MVPIAKGDRERMAADRRYGRCVMGGYGCAGAVEWHHALRYAGRQVNEPFAIVPLCRNHHRGGRQAEGLRAAELVALTRISDAAIGRRFGKSDWPQRKAMLSAEFGEGLIAVRLWDWPEEA